MDLPGLPPKPATLLELEQRGRSIRAQRIEIEKQLRGIETVLSRAAMGDDLDEIAEQLADGTLTEVKTSDLPAEQAELRKQLDIVIRADQKTQQKVIRERELYNREIVRVFRPFHRAAVQRIARAVEELIDANAAEAAVRAACPVSLVSLMFPNVGTMSVNQPGSARYWKQYATSLGFFEPDEPGDAPGAPPPAKKKRKLFTRSNGLAQPMPLAAKGGN